ncbi:MAG: hypothetical protein E7262_09045 [Lachnospiraceae bacterium]|nr:hypothetical protein [Lachnospiraceae bacterium]
MRIEIDNYLEKSKQSYNQVYLCLVVPIELWSRAGEVIEFDGGYGKVTGINIHDQSVVVVEDTLAEMECIIPDVAKEDVRANNSKKKVYYYDKDAPDGMMGLGQLNILNYGDGYSCEKEFTITIDKELLVSYVGVDMSIKDKSTVIKYSLQDNKGNLIYFNSVGDIVSKGTSGARDTWSIEKKNDYYGVRDSANYISRADLPAAHKQYFFKKVNYKIGGVDGSYGDVTTWFYGYLRKDVVLDGNYYINQKVVSTGNPSIADLNSRLTVIPVKDKVLEGSMTLDTWKTNLVMTGTSFDVSGYVELFDNQNQTAQQTKDMIFAVAIPKGITIKKEGLKMSLDDGTIVDVKSVTSRSVGEDLYLWTIKLDPSIYIGYFKDDLEVSKSQLNFDPITNGDKIRFNITMDVSNSIGDTNLHTKDMFYFTSLNGEFDGILNYYSDSDPWDINENGDTDEMHIKARAGYDQLISIIDDGMAVGVNDSITSDKGNVTDNGVSIKSSKDNITYSVRVRNLKRGVLQKHEQYIAIPKKNSVIDGYLINESDKPAFDFKLVDRVTFSGNDIFEAYYTVEEGLDFIGLRDLDKSKWYTSNDLLKTYSYADVTGVKIVLKNNQAVSVDFDVSIAVKMQATSEKNEINKDDFNSWKSRCYYTYEYSEGKVGGYINTAGCQATIEYEVDEDVEDAGRKEDDSIAGTNMDEYDETPATKDILNSSLRKWLCLLFTSFALIVVIRKNRYRVYL